MIMVTLGTGVGGGIIINDKILAGSHGAAGEIGHAHAEDAVKDPCNCGNCGCLEQLASATGIVRLAKEELAASADASVLRESEVSAKTVFDAVKAGDDLAIRIAERFGKYLGEALAIQSWSRPSGLYSEILSGICIYRLQGRGVCSGYSGQ